MWVNGTFWMEAPARESQVKERGSSADCLWLGWRYQNGLSGAVKSGSQDTPEVTWGPCCFCAQRIVPTTTDPCRVTVETQGEKWQLWFCHAACFNERLTDPPEAPGMFAPAHF